MIYLSTSQGAEGAMTAMVQMVGEEDVQPAGGFAMLGTAVMAEMAADVLCWV